MTFLNSRLSYCLFGYYKKQFDKIDGYFPTVIITGKSNNLVEEGQMLFNTFGVGQTSGRNNGSTTLDELKVGSGVDWSRHHKTNVCARLPQHLCHLVRTHSPKIDFIDLKNVVSTLQTIVLRYIV